jgi:hypothetical protein
LKMVGLFYQSITLLILLCGNLPTETFAGI